MILILYIALTLSSVGRSEDVIKGYIKCIPFHSHTAIPIKESDFHELSSPRWVFKKTSIDRLRLSQLHQALKKATRLPGHKREDYDLRMKLQFRLSNGIQETFYVDRDKKGLLYNHQFYYITTKEFDLIEQTYSCTYCRTGDMSSL